MEPALPSNYRPPLQRLVQVFCLVIVLGVGVLFGVRYFQVRHHLTTARQALAQGDFTLAKDHLNQVLRLKPRLGEAHFLLARIDWRTGAPVQAREHLAVCQRLLGATKAVVLEGLLIRAREGQLSKEEEEFLQACVQRDHPESLVILEALSLGFNFTYRLSAAYGCLTQWHEREPKNFRVLLLRAAVDQGLHATEQALADYHQALELEPENDQARLELATFLAFSKKPREALAHFEVLQPKRPNDKLVLLGMARSYVEQGQNEKALKFLENVLALDGGDLTALREMGKIAFEANKYAEAESFLRTAAAKDPYDRDVLYFLSQCLDREGKKEEGALVFKKFKKIDEDLNRLSQLTYQVDKNPRDADLRREAGDICFRNGQDAEGLRWLQGALQIDPGHRATHQALAEYYAKIGDQEASSKHQRLSGKIEKGFAPIEKGS